MICVFIQLRCRPGRTYEVADAIYDREFASELYSTSGEYDLMMKVYIPEGDGHRPLRQREDPRHPAHRPQPDDADLQGVLMIVDWDDAYANAPHIPGGDDYPPRWEALARGVPRRAWASGCARASPTGRIRGSGSTSSCRRARRAGLVVFVHGGYWRAFDRGDWSHLAAGPLARGWAVAMPGYVLAPEARIAAITAMIARGDRRGGGARWRGRSGWPAIRPAGIWWRGRSAPTAGCPPAVAGADRPGGADQRAARPAAAAAARR